MAESVTWAVVWHLGFGDTSAAQVAVSGPESEARVMSVKSQSLVGSQSQPSQP